ncbi:DHA2 family efflux MFS transporter permease subunit [Aestuariivirga sp.]|uniref:DHA2 family efflux MFS transporter permease subunit n=1 Tax=Aestuariivirga sp. TaxID=2650926 RepID=UPI0039E36CA9
MTTESVVITTHHELPRLRRWAGYIALCVGMFMAILDIQVVVTSLKTIEEALNIGADRMSWVQTSYLIAEVIAIPIIGLLMRVFGMKRLFVGALGLFTLASIGCALSIGFWDLMVWRVIQGFAGGVLIPLVFSAIFLLFPRSFEQTLATTAGGFLAVLAPTMGPVTGGWLTEHFSWHWLFLINVIPGFLAVATGLFALPPGRFERKLIFTLDWLSLLAFGVALALLIVGLKEAPTQGWLSPLVLGLFAGSAAALVYSVMRKDAAIMFHLLHDRALAYGCVLSFLLGFILFASVYILPVFFAFVRGMTPLQIGLITITMGVMQIIAAPFTVLLDRYFDARVLTAAGFIVFAAGLLLNANLTVNSGEPEVFWAQIIRGGAVALCILPPIRMALALQPIAVVSDASGLFNVVRNIGGAIGIAIMDTVMFTRGPTHADEIMEKISTAPDVAAAQLGIPLDTLPSPDDAMSMMGIMDLIQNASLTQAINDCWWLLAAVALVALPVLWLLGPIDSARPVWRRKPEG